MVDDVVEFITEMKKTSPNAMPHDTPFANRFADVSPEAVIATTAEDLLCATNGRPLTEVKYIYQIDRALYT